MINELRPIMEDDFVAFEQYVDKLPPGTIVGKACDVVHCPVAIWWSARYGVTIWVSFLRHGVGESVSLEQYDFNPMWVRFVVSETDGLCTGEVTKEYMQEYILPRVKDHWT